jgi:lysophospholipase L1-like esterase
MTIGQKILAWVLGAFFTFGNLFASEISVTDSNVLAGLTLNDWVCQPDFIGSSVAGASLTVGFNGTRHVALLVDNRQLSNSAPARHPIIAWSVNGGNFQSRQLSARESTVLLAADVTNPVIDLYIKGMSPFEDRYSGDVPANSVRITGFSVDAGGSTMPAVPARKVWLNIGDSIMSGDEAAYAAGQGRPPDDGWAAASDARASYGYLLARHYGYQETRLAYGGYDWGRGLARVPALAKLIDQKTSTISRLKDGKLNPIPDVVLINLGENGAPALKSVTNALVTLRSRVSPATKILVMIPVAGTARNEITRAFASYSTSTADTNAFLVDLGPITFATGDGQHPTAAGHQAIYQAALPFFDPIITPHRDRIAPMGETAK